MRRARRAGKVQTVIAVSNVGLDKAPWADALCSYDANWWKAYGGESFTGRKFSAFGSDYTEKFHNPTPSFMNSGLMAMFVARDVFFATEIALLGFDMQGSHYFGEHKGKGNKPLVNTTPSGFATHIKQFRLFTGALVYNATRNSALKCYPFIELAAYLDAN